MPRRLKKLTGDLDVLLADPALAEHEQDWVWADLTDARRPEDAMGRVRSRFPHAIQLSWQRLPRDGDALRRQHELRSPAIGRVDAMMHGCHLT